MFTIFALIKVIILVNTILFFKETLLSLNNKYIKMASKFSIGTRRLPSKKPKISEAEKKKIEEKKKSETMSVKTFMELTSRTEYEEAFPFVEIEDILMQVLSEEDIVRQAVVKVDKEDFEPISGSINDPKMGVTSRDELCATCSKTYTTCDGHMGYIRLNTYVYHRFFIRQIISVLRSVCNSCGSLLIDESEYHLYMKYTGNTRLKLIEAASLGKDCTSEECTRNPLYDVKESKEKLAIFIKIEGKFIEKNIKEVYKILSVISEKDAQILGFTNGAHPKNFILTVLPVIPPCARPPNEVENTICHDHITIMYHNIVKNNRIIGESARITENERNNAVKLLIDNIHHLFDNTDKRFKTASKSSSQPYNTITTRIKGKDAVIRQAIQGKRVNFSARSVAGPDPTLRMDEVGIPKIMAPYLTKKEIVNTYNKEFLEKLLKEDKVTFVKPASGERRGTRIKISDANKDKIQLHIGDEVERHLMNGDYVIANRQPTIHLSSFMAFRVVLMEGYTIRLHLSTTTPFNADFDGDEINIHSPQTYEAEAELREILNIKNCIINPENNRPIVSLVYDSLVAATMLTSPNTIVSASVYNSCLMELIHRTQLNSLDKRLKAHGVDKYSGKGLFSALFPEDFYYNYNNSVIIIDGILVSGVINKNNIGNSENSIIAQMWHDYGKVRTADFITDASYLLVAWLSTVAISPSIADCFPSDKSYRELIAEEISKAKVLVQAYGTNLTSPYEEQRKEQLIISQIDIARSVGANLVEKGLTADNPFKIMVTSGAKGSAYNIGQISGIVGQQFLKNQRMPYMQTGQRCLPYFKENETDPVARGFCENSFVTGLSPAELFFSQAAGRESLTSIAAKTPEIGSLSHKTKRALENLIVYTDSSVRDLSGNIIQFTYGDDGFASEYLIRVNTVIGKIVSFINLDHEAQKLNIKYGYKPEYVATNTIESVNEITVEMDLIDAQDYSSEHED